MDEYKLILIAGERYYGKQLLLHAEGGNENIRDIDVIGEFIQKLPSKIDMIAHGDPLIERFGYGIGIGISALQLIETSSITIHTNDQAGEMYLDLFSCKDFQEELVIAFLTQVFVPRVVDWQVVLRK